VSDAPEHIEVQALIKALERRSSKADEVSLVSGKNINVLVMGVICAVGALIWTTTIKTPENFSVLQQQTAEIRTTVLEMKTTLGDINSRLDSNTRATSEQQAKISGLESSVKSNTDRLDRLERGIQDAR
jgi:hypothetical protein